MGTLLGIAFCVVLFVIVKKADRRSYNRTTPSGYHKDLVKANRDIILKGKDYYYKQNLDGKYDVPDKK